MNIDRSIYRLQQSLIGSLRLRTFIWIFVVMALPLLLNADPPSWWSYWGVIDPSQTPNDYAAVNQGQLKFIAQQAAAEMTAHLPGGINVPAGADLQTLLTTLNNPSASTNDYAAVNLGQLKATAKPFYELLMGVGYTNAYPWTGSSTPPNDYAAANIGQVKNLFSFDLMAVTAANDLDGDGIPDWWEKYYFPTKYPSSSFNPNAPAPRGDGLTILQAFQQGLNPNDFYNGQTPTLTIASGNNQTAVPGSFVAYPLIVQVADASGNPIQGAPVTYSVKTGGGQLQLSSSASPKTTVNILSDANGQAKVFFQAPSTTSTTCIVTATTMAGSTPILCPAFTEMSSDGTGIPNPTPTDSNGPDDPDGPQTVPVQSYACIDTTVPVAPTGGSYMALDDNNDLGIQTVTSGSAIVDTYEWQNGTLGSPQLTNCLINGFNADGTPNSTYLYPYAVLPTGELLGVAFYMTYEMGLPVFEQFTFISVDGVVTTSNMPGFTAQNGPGIDTITAVANNGTYAGTAGASFNVPTSDGSGISFTFICSGGSYVAFDPTGELSAIDSSITVVSDPLSFYEIFDVNSSGQAAGIYDSTYEYTVYWDGVKMNLVGQGSPAGLNDQGQVIASYYLDDVYPEGYLWENGTTTILVNHLPASLQGQIQDIQPLSISNQANPGTDATIYILANAQVNGAAATIVCTRDNDGNWSFAQVGLPDGASISQYVSINSSGAIAVLGTGLSDTDGTAGGQTSGTNAQPTPNQTASPSPSTQGGIATPIDISLTFAYPNPLDHSRTDVEADLMNLPGIQGNPDVNGDVKTYHYTIEGGTGKKNWTVQTSANQQSLVSALQSVPYVYFSGHANDGAGLALKVNSSAADLTTTSVTSINDFMHLRNPQCAVPWLDFFTDRSEYPSFGANAIPEAQIPTTASNYAVTINFTPNPIVDANGIPDNERYPNIIITPGKPDGTKPPGGTFTLTGAGMNQQHMIRQFDDGSLHQFVVVNVPNEIKPTFGYKILLAAVCNGARDYGEVFNHGCFISTTDYASLTQDIPRIFVQTLMNGGNSNDILTALEAAQYHDFTQKTY